MLTRLYRYGATRWRCGKKRTTTECQRGGSHQETKQITALDHFPELWASRIAHFEGFDLLGTNDSGRSGRGVRGDGTGSSGFFYPGSAFSFPVDIANTPHVLETIG